MSILRDGVHYDLVNESLKEDIDFYCRKAQEVSGPVLELCCGTGRITIPMAKAGKEVVGLDLSPSMLDQARRKAVKAGTDIRWIQGDATQFALGSKFQLITTPFNSIQLFGNLEKLRSYFRCVREHLTSDGQLIFDVYNPNLNYLASKLKARRPGGSYTHPDTGELVTVEWENVYDDARQVNGVTFFYATDRQGEFATDYLEARCFYPLELDYLVESQGYKITEKLGDFSGKRFSKGDPKQIIVCRPL